MVKNEEMNVIDAFETKLKEQKLTKAEFCRKKGIPYYVLTNGINGFGMLCASGALKHEYFKDTSAHATVKRGGVLAKIGRGIQGNRAQREEREED